MAIARSISGCRLKMAKRQDANPGRRDLWVLASLRPWRFNLRCATRDSREVEKFSGGHSL